MTLQDRFRVRQERRLALLMQRDAMRRQIQGLKQALQQIDCAILACDGAMEELESLINAAKDDPHA